MTLFKKAIVFSDIHLGLRNNARQHNIDCIDFIKWAIEEGKAFGAETFIFCGDWHHFRSALNISTMNYTLYAFELLSNAFENCYVIAGNHDEFYREKREINSISFGKHIKNIHIINDFYTDGDVTFLPWLVGDEWKKISKIKSKYIFSHLELPHFKMNQMVEMPDHGGINHDIFKNQEYVFSGHFHKRQWKKNQADVNVVYVGNCFPHNYADSFDNERGVMLMEWNGKPQFKAWSNAPRYVQSDLTTVLSDPDQYLNKHTYAKITINSNISYEEAVTLKEMFASHYNLRELKLIPLRQGVDEIEYLGDMEFESIDQIVTNQILSLDVNKIDPQILLQIYNSL